MCCIFLKIRKEYLFVGQADILQDATEVELLDRKFPKTKEYIAIKSNDNCVILYMMSPMSSLKYTQLSKARVRFLLAHGEADNSVIIKAVP